MTRRLVLLRHGQTAWNTEKRIQGQTDVDLDEVGALQAKQVAPLIAGLQPAMLVSSDLLRARRTADAIAEASGLAAALDPRLREFLLGERQGLTHAEYAAVAPEEFERFHNGRWSGIPGAEAPEEVAARYRAALDEIVASLGAGRTAVVVSHGAAIKVGTVAFLGWPLAAAADLRGMSNCGRVVLEERTPDHWVLAGYNLPPDFTSTGGCG